MGANLPGGGFDGLELALASRTLATGHDLADAANGKAHERVTGAGGRKKVGGHRLQVAPGRIRLSSARPTGVRAGLGFIAAQIDDPVRTRAQIESHGQALETEVQTIDLGDAEFVEGRRIVVSGKERGSGGKCVIDAREAAIELGRPDVTPIPRG